MVFVILILEVVNAKQGTQFQELPFYACTRPVKYLLFTCFRLQPLLLLQDFLIDCVRIMSLFFRQSVLFALLSWTYIAFQAKNHWSEERIRAKEAQECHWLDFSQLLLRNPVLLEVSQRNSAKEKKPRLTINCWGEWICSLVNPLVDSHPPIHSDMVKTPVNKCRFSLPTSE